MLTSGRFWIGGSVTTVFIALLMYRLDFAEMGRALADANYFYLIPAIIVYFGSLYFRSYRWRFLLKPFTETSTMRLYPVVMVGYMANNLLPMRIGELARSYYLSTREPVRGSTALATILIERVFDGLTLLFILAASALFLPVFGLAERVSDSTNLPIWVVGTALVVPFFAVFALMISAASYQDLFKQSVSKVVRFAPAKYRDLTLGFLVRFLSGFEGLHHPRRLATVFILTIPIWAAEGTMYYIIALGFDLHAEFTSVGLMIAAMLVLTSVSNLATSIPSSQGSVGPFEFFASLCLVFLGISGGVATAYAVVLHLALLLPVIAGGFIHLAIRGISFKELSRTRAKNIAEEESNQVQL